MFIKLFFTHIAVVCTFLMLYRILLYEYAIIYFSTVYVHLDCYQRFSIINNDGMNILLHISWYTQRFS